MGYEVRVLLDSMAPSGHRLTTMLATYPRYIHSEVLTHRDFSRNSGSSRAIPSNKMRQRITEDPVFPLVWGSNQKGMQAGGEVSRDLQLKAKSYWTEARDAALLTSAMLDSFGIHKQVVNRPTEPFMWMTTLISATEWSNFFALRCDEAAQPEFQRTAYEMADLYGVDIEPPSAEFIALALMMRAVWEVSVPRQLEIGQWHLPFITADDWGWARQQGIERRKGQLFYEQCIELLRKVSTGRCARLSYLTHEGKRDPLEDVNLHDRLIPPGHMSPAEHQAMAIGDPDYRSGNFRGWQQYRKIIPNECR